MGVGQGRSFEGFDNIEGVLGQNESGGLAPTQTSDSRSTRRRILKQFRAYPLHSVIGDTGHIHVRILLICSGSTQPS